ncbi:MAG: hypothetical protein E5299_00460 [Burkholderia gladioli]|nr:MAG: hypothetical protein E5299_00460 [Burkholderia gladioli]
MSEIGRPINEGLINRGNVTIWIDEAVLARIPDAIPTYSRPCLYGDTLIQALLGVKSVYRRTLRALQGFTQSLHALTFPSLPVPHYTTLCRRTKMLDVELPILRDHELIHLVVDSTGLKDYGEGEWKLRQHSYSKRCTWRNGAVDAIARDGRREWKKDSAYHRRSLAENTMYWFKTLTSNCLWAHHINLQATEVAIRVGVINRISGPRGVVA